MSAPWKRDNHSSPNFAHEGDELRAFMAERKNTVAVQFEDRIEGE